MAATVDHRCIRPQNDVHGKGTSGIVRMRKGVSHGNMQCVHACLLAPLCNLDRVFECVPVPSGKDAKRAVQVAPGEFYDERKLASDRILNCLDYLQQEPCPILQNASVTIRSVINGGLRN
jgi:hypothetical protein